MNAQGTAGSISNGMIVTVTESGKKPDFRKTAPMLLKRCRDFYQNPENERAFQEWKAGKKAKHEKAV